MAQEGTREYLPIPKGRGFVYAYETKSEDRRLNQISNMQQRRIQRK